MKANSIKQFIEFDTMFYIQKYFAVEGPGLVLLMRYVCRGCECTVA